MLKGTVVASLFLQHLGRRKDHRENIVEIVCDSSGKHADRFHLLRMEELIFEELAFARVAKNAEHHLVVGAEDNERVRNFDRHFLVVPQRDIARETRGYHFGPESSLVVFKNSFPFNRAERDGKKFSDEFFP